MEPNPDEILDQYFEKKKAGITFSEIRKQLNQKGIDPDTISSIITEIDNRLISEARERSTGGYKKELKGIGLFLMTAGGVVTLGTYIGILNLEGIYIVAWGPIIGGYALILISRGMSYREKRIRKKGNYIPRK